MFVFLCMAAGVMSFSVSLFAVVFERAGWDYLEMGEKAKMCSIFLVGRKKYERMIFGA